MYTSVWHALYNNDDIRRSCQGNVPFESRRKLIDWNENNSFSTGYIRVFVGVRVFHDEKTAKESYLSTGKLVGRKKKPTKTDVYPAAQ